MFEVRVPATSANLGPGFDTLGIALTLYGRFVFTETDTPLDAEHLALDAYAQALKRLGKTGPSLTVASTEVIPIGKGLGSSAACIVAGVLAANHVSGAGLAMNDLVMLAAEIEGHPDNVAPALLGGLVASGWQEGRLLTGQLPVSTAWSFALLIPDQALSTKAARQVLPASVSFTDAVYNLSQLGCSISALAGHDDTLLHHAFGDRLHQPYRFPLIAESAAIMRLAKEHGALAVTLSGAGPAFLLIRRKGDALDSLKTALAVRPDCGWNLHLAEIDTKGAQLSERI